MQFTTKIPIQKSSFPIDYDSKILLLGSCFAENMGEKFDYFKFQTTINPFGIIFNSVSIEKLIRRSIEKRKFTENDIFFHNDLWHCFEVHSELSNSDKDIFLESLNDLISTTNKQLSDSTHIIITLGTSWVYQNIASHEIVANCHKVPQKQFTKELLSIQQIEESLESIISLVHSVNPNCKFIFTVSPVRHIKDGFVENTLSKAHLIAAIHKTIILHPSLITYFPSYEIMLDELRDYRFYAEDMLHPSQTAIDYIWIQFFENYISESQFSLMNDICSIQKGLKHRPFNPNTESHQKFLHQLELKIKTIQNQHPFIKFC
ncbi:GSCFA domain-containing protein [Flavobacterium lacisediminis]|uniref:GSCFA domain-containing protein n=1 Tax=Flavobacterium lacisediminis TaxID=2989705 RepID=A0ABT3EFY0_9FLAO|nr:GSCFA domain-containing protein [Flavobacterium lacisediminis]MCW1147339.1 GSCFA domain-containing protein [Flavobacterium lacisediminis]